MTPKRFLLILSIVAALLMVPLVAMQFTTEVVWTRSDFVIMGILLLGFVLLADFVWRQARRSKYRLLLVAAVVGTFVLVWAELAVGVFGTP